MERNDYLKKVDAKEELIIEALGYEEAFNNLSKALSYNDKEEMYDYIIRMWDLDYNEDE